MTRAEREPVLSVRGLSVRFLMPGGRRVAAVTDAHFDVAAGECLALIGESGCGKSVLASALLGLLPANAQTAGQARLGYVDEAGRRGRGDGEDMSRAQPRDSYNGGETRHGDSYGAGETRHGDFDGAGETRHGDFDDPGRKRLGDLDATCRDRLGDLDHTDRTRLASVDDPGRDQLRDLDTTDRTRLASPDATGWAQPRNPDTTEQPHLTGLDLLAADERTLARTVRGRRIGLVPQSPAAHLTPVRTVRSHLEETVAALTGARGRAAVRAAAEAAAARTAFPADHLDRHPHELSGGLAQRAATALALVGGAPLLLADEPTTGLDRDLVERTVDELRRHIDAADRGLLLITHDLAAAERIADRVAVMYAGRIVEITDAAEFFGTPGPRHPYSRGLLQALPDRAFTPIPGLPPELGDLPAGCAFAARCDRATDACATLPRMTDAVACHHPHVPEDARA